VVALRLNTMSNIKVVKLPIFNGDAIKVLKFIMACKLYIRMRIRDMSVEKQV